MLVGTTDGINYGFYLEDSKDKLIAKDNTLNDMQKLIDYISKKYNI